MFKVGDNIVYPMHGAGTIESIEEREVLGETQKYYVMKMPVGDIKVMVPTKNAEMIGVRDVIGNERCEGVLDVFDNNTQIVTSNWNKRYRDNMEKMKTGDIYEVAGQAVKSITWLTTKGKFADKVLVCSIQKLFHGCLMYGNIFTKVTTFRSIVDNFAIPNINCIMPV